MAGVNDGGERRRETWYSHGAAAGRKRERERERERGREGEA